MLNLKSQKLQVVVALIKRKKLRMMHGIYLIIDLNGICVCEHETWGAFK